MSANIKTVLNEYIRVDDELKIINKQVSSLRNQRNALSEQINDYLETNSGEPNSVIEMGSNVFKLIKYTKKKVNKSNLEEILKKKINNDEQVKNLMDELTEEKEESYIKRSIKK